MYVAMVLRSHVCIIDKLLVVGVHFFFGLGHRGPVVSVFWAHAAACVGPYVLHM